MMFKVARLLGLQEAALQPKRAIQVLFFSNKLFWLYLLDYPMLNGILEKANGI
jgi:hypothetical protein